MSNLNRAIAEALGWQCVCVEKETETICKPPNKGSVIVLPGSYVIYNPQGEPIWTEGQHHDPERAWEYALQYLIPDWAHDLGAAVQLCTDVMARSEHLPYRPATMWGPYEEGGYIAWIVHGPLQHEQHMMTVAKGATPARALAELAFRALS